MDRLLGWYSTFFSAVGCDVVNGLKYVPDLKALSVLDPTGANATSESERVAPRRA